MFSLNAPAAIVALAALALGQGRGHAEPPAFEKLHRMIQPQPGESRWMQVLWLTSVWEAREKAAREGKPIFIWAGSGGGPAGVC